MVIPGKKHDGCYAAQEARAGLPSSFTKGTCVATLRYVCFEIHSARLAGTVGARSNYGKRLTMIRPCYRSHWEMIVRLRLPS
jgi:hypothetical protein